MVDNAWFEEHRKAVIQWADIRFRQAESGEQEFVIIDCETTDMSGKAEPVQLTVLGWNGQPLLNTLVKPGCKIHPDAFRVHGLSWDKVKHAPTFPQVMETFRRCVTGRIVIAYNLQFDRRIIRQTVEKYHLSPPGAAGYECAMLQFGRFWGTLKKNSKEFKWHSLNDACEFMEIERDAAHASLVDCQATLQLMQAMATAKYER